MVVLSVLFRALLMGVIVSGLGNSPLSGADQAAIQAKFEALAQQQDHFSRWLILGNQSSFADRHMPHNQLGEALHRQGELLDQLRSLSVEHEAVIALLKHPDPKVRTLALGALYLHLDGRDLPLIAPLMEDPADTFPDVYPFATSAPAAPLSSYEKGQTVGAVARHILGRYHVMPKNKAVEQYTLQDFDVGWRKYEGRTFAASWFEVKMNFATRSTTPIQKEYRTDIDRVIAEMDALPPPDRDWTRLYILCEHRDEDDVLVDDRDLVPTARLLGSDALMRFLQYKSVSSDPDLFDRFPSMANFMLKHAGELLRKSDCDALLACEAEQPKIKGFNPWWRIAVAQLQPDRAPEILKAALDEDPPPAAAALWAVYLWRMGGLHELPALVDWYYKTPPSGLNVVGGGQAFFLREVQKAGLKENHDLIAALVKDSRFDQSKWEALKEILIIANQGWPKPIVKLTEIYRGRTEPDDSELFKKWRRLLREAYPVP